MHPATALQWTDTLNPLLGECGHIFKCDDIEGLAVIQPTEVCFYSNQQPTVSITWKADSDLSLFDRNPYGKCLLPPDAHSIVHAKFRYQLRHRTDWQRITVHRGRSLTYERDGDSVVIEEWLRRRNFVKNLINTNLL